MKKSEILEEAVSILRTGEHEYVCHAIGKIRFENYLQRESHLKWLDTSKIEDIDETIVNCDELRYWIEEYLKSLNTDIVFDSYSDYLQYNYPSIFDSWLTEDFIPMRIQWVEWMIQHWKAKGE